ncbi:MAG: transposase, partial [Candidatus Binatia bacterium]
MPRGPRLDAPGVLHHVMARGIERGLIFRDDVDRDGFLRRLSAVATDSALAIYAWALLPNHLHLLLKTGRTPLPMAMRWLLTGHAISFNRRHDRVGHLFQNRYKSIVCEEEPYFLELVRYIHLNPLRAGIVRTLCELDAYPYSGHSAVLGVVPRQWQETSAVLRCFAVPRDRAAAAYRAFVGGGVDVGRRPDLVGGGLVRSAGGWNAVRELRRGRESFAHDERVLGTSGFVENVARETKAVCPIDRRRRIPLSAVIGLVCRALRTEPASLGAGRRPRTVSRAREGIAFLWIAHFGGSGHELAAALGISAVSAYRCA